MNLFDEFFQIIRAASAARIRYAVVGGIAMSFHDQPWSEGVVKVARKADLIWLKEQRNSDQDRVDIARLRDDKD